jgi:hypothetical protein
MTRNDLRGNRAGDRDHSSTRRLGEVGRTAPEIDVRRMKCDDILP